MALADYYLRAAVAASQVLAGYDEKRIRERLETVQVGIAVGTDAVKKPEGHLILDLSIRILARLYPSLAVRSGDASSEVADRAIELARRVNPNIEIASTPTIEVAIGTDLPPAENCPRIFVGSKGWTGTVGTQAPYAIGRSENPFGPGIAACLAAANVFRHTFLGKNARLDKHSTLSAITGNSVRRIPATPKGELGDVVLVGAGAIGNGAAWAFSNLKMIGTLHIVDHEAVDLGNLQRYVLAERSNENASKVEVLKGHFHSSIEVNPHPLRFERFIASNGSNWESMLLALDSAKDRRAAQASLPKWIANAWTQPGDLGVSVHDFRRGACVACLYLPDRALQNEDELIATALNIPERLTEIRTLLFTGNGVSRELLDAIAVARQISVDNLLPFEGRSVRSLYVDGFCGGAVVPLGGLGTPRQDVHVPLAHQSALAGILLSAASVQHALIPVMHGTTVTRVDLMRSLGQFVSQPAAKDPRHICICQDGDYQTAYSNKYV